MKTSVEKLYFDWQDPNTGESPKSYQIRVSTPGSDYDGDLMTHRLMKLLKEYGSEVVNFPKTLLTEIYEDCCWAFAGHLFTSSVLEYMEENGCDVFLRNYTHLSTEEWVKLADDIITCMRLRVLADASRYLEIVTTPMPDEFKEAIRCNNRIIEANENYATSGDLVLSVEDESLMPELTLVLLGLRRGFWRGFWQNADKFEPFSEEETADAASA